MICRPAEASFQKGQKALSDGQFLEALAFFEASLALSRQLGEGPPQPRYLSFYGYCLSRQPRRLHEALEICEQAAKSEPYNPDIWLNLARVRLQREDRASAYQAVVRGLESSPGHAGLMELLRQMGVRRKPVIPFLARSNPINKFLGRMRADSANNKKKR